MAACSHQLAEELLRNDWESTENPRTAAAACHVSMQRLYRSLRPLIGSAGFQTVLAGAAIRGAAGYPCLGGLEIPPAGVPSARSMADALGGADGAESAVALVDEMLAFLGRLVGWDLILRVLQDEWPLVERYDAAALERTMNAEKES